MEKDSKQQLNANKWDTRAANYDNKIFDYFRSMQKKVIALLDLKENVRVLNVGCGTGWAVRYTSQLAGDNGEIYGIDISSMMIEKAKEHSKGYKNVFFSQADSENMPFEDNYYDFLICMIILILILLGEKNGERY